MKCSNMIFSTIAVLLSCNLVYSFTPGTHTTFRSSDVSAKSSTSLTMVDTQTIEVAGISIAGLATGIGLLAFTDTQATRSNERGGLSDSQTTKIVGGLVVEETEEGPDAGSLASQLEKALKQSGSLTEEDAETITESVEQDYDGGDGW